MKLKDQGLKWNTRRRGVLFEISPPNLQLSPHSLLIITIESLHFLKFKHKSIFNMLFFFFFSSWFEKGERNSLVSSDKEKDVLTFDSDYQNGWSPCQVVPYDKRSSTWMFFLTWKCLNIYINPIRFLILSFKMVFWGHGFV